MAFTSWNDILNKPKGIADVEELALTVEQLSASVLSISEDVGELELSVSDLSASVLSISEDVGELALDVSQLSASVLSIASDVDSLKEHSTSEEAIGEWIDGSTLYRKVINLTTVESGNNTVPHGISNLSAIISIVGTFSAFGNTYSLPNFSAESINAVTYSVNSENVVITVGANISGNLSRLSLTLTYTKSTP